MAITDWPAPERPREKLLRLGAQALSDAELLAIFLRTGVTGRTAVDLSRHLLQHFQGLRGILEAKPEAFCQIHGLGLAKYTQLQASLEIAHRHLFSSMQKGEVMRDPAIVTKYLQHRLRPYQREVFGAIFLDNGHCVLAYEELFFGGLREVTIHPRELISRALAHNAAAIIISHNHPSGNVTPSKEDKHLTMQLKSALQLVDMQLLDHIIIGDGKTLSFAEEGLMI